MSDRKKYMKEYNKNYYNKNREKLKEHYKQYYKNNREKLLEQNKQWAKNNPEEYKENQRKWREKNLKYIRQYYQNNSEKINERSLKWGKDNSKKVRIKHNKDSKNRLKIDTKYNLNFKMRIAIGNSLKGSKKGRHWEDLVGYTVNDLIKRLKKTIPEGYNWNDYLKGKLHIDHIIPISVFNFDRPKHADFKRCWALNNLRLLLAKENRIKHNKLDRSFQPALKF